jgi:hypothetical protein
MPSPVYEGFFSFGYAADATKLVIAGARDGVPFDLDPGAGSEVITQRGATITRFAF